MIFLIFFTFIFSVFAQENETGNTENAFSLTIIHTNDIHAHFMESDKDGNTCSEDGPCYGGAARRATVIKDIRSNHQNVLLLDAGDQSQGTPWYNVYKGSAAAHFLEKLDYDAFAIGNHEFDRGVESFAENFVGNISDNNSAEDTLPILSCNIDASSEPSINGKFKCSQVIEFGDVKIGIIGYTTEETPDISDSGKLIFNNVVQAIQTESERLRKTENCDILIGVGHYGYQADQDMAAQVDLDIIIGGHSHSLLWSDSTSADFDENDSDKVIGAYPTFVTNTIGRDVPICQAFEYGKYLGHIDVKFEVTTSGYQIASADDVVGHPILLDSNIEQDPDVLKELKQWEKPVDVLVQGQIGKSIVYLDGTRTSCRRHECNMGNFVTDAMLRYQQKKTEAIEQPWKPNQICALSIMNSGGIRSSLSPGEINFGDLLTVFPFEGFFIVTQTLGSTIRKGIEHSVRRYVEEAASNPGEFLQFSGFKIVFNMANPSGSRIESIKIRCEDCEIPNYVDLENEKDYCVIFPDFLARTGGDGFSMFPDEILNSTVLGLDTDVIGSYITESSPIYYGREERIIIKDEPDTSDATITSLSFILLCMIRLL